MLFDELIESAATEGSWESPLDPLFDRGAWVLFRQRDGVFHVESSRGVEPEEVHYPFLSEEPDLWTPVLSEGVLPLPGEYAMEAGSDLWVAVDRCGDPEYLLLAESPSGTIPDGPVVRFALALHLSRSRRVESESGGTLRGEAEEGDGIELPAWLNGAIDEMMDLESPFLVLSEGGSGREELVREYVRRRFGSMDSAIHFHPGRLSGAVQLREFFGDSAGARLGGGGGRIPILQRGAEVVVVQEASDLAMEVQERLLEMFESEESNLFWIFESSRDLEAMGRAGEFHLELYRLLARRRVVLPPLRACRSEIPGEVERILLRLQEEWMRSVSITPEAVDRLVSHDWPGNLRELNSVLESAFFTCSGGMIQEEDIRPGQKVSGEEMDDLNLRRRSRELEKSLILRAYSLHGGNQVQMARALGISRGSLQYKLEKYEIHKPASSTGVRPH